MNDIDPVSNEKELCELQEMNLFYVYLELFSKNNKRNFKKLITVDEFHDYIDKYFPSNIKIYKDRLLLIKNELGKRILNKKFFESEYLANPKDFENKLKICQNLARFFLLNFLEFTKPHDNKFIMIFENNNKLELELFKEYFLFGTHHILIVIAKIIEKYAYLYTLTNFIDKYKYFLDFIEDALKNDFICDSRKKESEMLDYSEEDNFLSAIYKNFVFEFFQSFIQYKMYNQYKANITEKRKSGGLGNTYLEPTLDKYDSKKFDFKNTYKLFSSHVLQHGIKIFFYFISINRMEQKVIIEKQQVMYKLIFNFFKPITNCIIYVLDYYFALSANNAYNCIDILIYSLEKLLDDSSAPKFIFDKKDQRNHFEKINIYFELFKERNFFTEDYFFLRKYQDVDKKKILNLLNDLIINFYDLFIFRFINAIFDSSELKINFHYENFAFEQKNLFNISKSSEFFKIDNDCNTNNVSDQNFCFIPADKKKCNVSSLYKSHQSQDFSNKQNNNKNESSSNKQNNKKNALSIKNENNKTSAFNNLNKKQNTIKITKKDYMGLKNTKEIFLLREFAKTMSNIYVFFTNHKTPVCHNIEQIILKKLMNDNGIAYHKYLCFKHNLII
ncbi:hypothetical protein GVAV_002223 [Gurleya vavrai]